MGTILCMDSLRGQVPREKVARTSTTIKRGQVSSHYAGTRLGLQSCPGSDGKGSGAILYLAP